MFDREQAGRLVSGATPFQRGIVATLCLWRASALKENSHADQEVRGFGHLVDDSLSFCRSVALGVEEKIGAESLAGRYREVVGSDEEPIEEPDGISAWFMDVVSLADYSVRTWRESHQSNSHCFDVMLYGYSLAGMLEDEPQSPSLEDLGDLEFARQIADLEAAANMNGPVGPAELDSLFAASSRLRDLYARRFLEILDESE